MSVAARPPEGDARPPSGRTSRSDRRVVPSAAAPAPGEAVAQRAEDRPVSPRAGSVRRRLFNLLVPCLIVLIVADAYLSYRSALEAAHGSYDRSLVGSVRSIAERVAIADDRIVVDLPYAALEMFEASTPEHVYYSVQLESGRPITGYSDLPLPPTRNLRQPVLYDGLYNDQEVRLVALLKPLFHPAVREPVLVIVAETLDSRKALARHILWGTVRRGVLFMLLAVLVVRLVVVRAFRPLLELRSAMRNRAENDLSPVQDDAVPTEVKPLTDAINMHVARIARMVDVRRRFIADAAHQLRTPLTVLNTQVEMALRHSGSEERQRILEQMNRSVHSATRLTNQLLSLSRAEPDHSLIGERSNVDVKALARDVAIDLSPLARRKDIDLGFEADEDDEDDRGGAVIAGDPVLLRELVANLVDNAIRYTPRGGTITVSVAGAAQRVTLKVCDDGPGIPEKERERVFQRFYRIPGGDVEGSGLGLSIVREICRTHGAEVVLGEGLSGRGLCAEVRFAR